MEYIVTSKSGSSHRIELSNSSESKILIDGKELSFDIQKTKMGLHIIHKGKGLNVDVIGMDHSEKTVTLRINSKRYHFEVKDKFDELLEKLGMDIELGNLVSEIKAPMPGLVLEVMVAEGEEVKANQAILILEAMKMENVIKAPADTTVKKVSITKGDSVEKNQLLVEFE
ncbi:MAG: biotin/lipoyl-containing protein [Vicingaceae bacterium]